MPSDVGDPGRIGGGVGIMGSNAQSVKDASYYFWTLGAHSFGPTDARQRTIANVLESFQQTQGLPVTGKLDDATKKAADAYIADPKNAVSDVGG